MSDTNRPLSGIQPTLPGARLIAPVVHPNNPSVGIPMVQNPYGMISAQPHQYISHLSYSSLQNAQGRIPVVGAIPPSMPGMFVPVAQASISPMLVPQIPPVQVPAGIMPQMVDPVKLLEQQKKLEKERNFQLQQQRLKQFTVAGKKGSINADNLIDSMFGKSQPKETVQHLSLPVKTKDSNETKNSSISTEKPFISPNTTTNTVSVSFSQCHPEKPVYPLNNTLSQEKAEKKGLDAMMLECSNLKAPSKANKFTKPIVKEMAPITQHRSNFMASNKARNWNDVKGLDEVFVEKRPRFPVWCCKESVPETYRKIESIVTENGAHPPETSLLFPILMSSNLPQQALASIWELVNLSAPGYLTVEEMYAALALIAVSQAGHVVKSDSVLHQLVACPIPQLQCFMTPTESTTAKAEGIATSYTAKPTVDNADDHSSNSLVQKVIRPTTIRPKIDNNSSSNSSMENHSSLPPVSTSGFVSSPDDEFDDFKSATPTCVNFFMYPNPRNKSNQEEDEFDDFKQAPTVALSSMSNIEMNTNATNIPKSELEEDLMSPEEDKYSVFRALQQNVDSSDWGDFAPVPSNSSIKDTDSVASFHLNQSSNSDSMKLDPPVPISSSDSKADDDFGDFLQAETKQIPDISTSLTNDFLNLNTNFADFSNFNENPQSLPTFNVSETSHPDDEFGEFASSLPVANKTEVGQEFLFCHLKDNISLAESQSVSSLELGTFDGGGHSGESKDSMSRQGSILSLDLKSSGLEANDGEDNFAEPQVASVLNRSSKSPSPAKDAKRLEYNNLSSSSGLNLQAMKSVSLTDKYSVIRSEERKDEDQHISCWTHCLQSTVNILQNTKKIFNQMSSSLVCNEVLSSEEGGNYIKDVIEVYKVVCRVALSSKFFGKQTTTILDLIKEANQAWNTICGFFVGSSLMPQDLLFDLSPTLLNSDNGNNVKACGLCLLNVEIKTSKSDENLILSYGGRNYHSTCANFWVNCVDPLLPALTLPQLL